MSTWRKSAGLRISLAIILVTVLFAGIAVPVQAAEFDQDGYVGPNEIIDDDLFISGENVRIEGTVNGMLVATGANVTITGKVNGDAILLGSTVEVAEGALVTGNVFAGASQVRVNGQVDGSVAMGGSVLYLEGAQVGRNVYLGGYSYEDDAQTEISRSMYGGAYQAEINGTIARNLNFGAAAVELNGTVNGDAVLNVEAPGSGSDMPFSPFMFMPAQPGVQVPATIRPGLLIAERAVIGGKLVYTSPAQQDSTIQTAPEGGVVYQTPVPEARPEDSRAYQRSAKPERGTFGFFASSILKWFWNIFRNMITLLLLGGLCVWQIPAMYKRTVEIAKQQPAPATGYGALVWLGGYFGAFAIGFLILFVGLLFSVLTLGGISSAVFGLGFSSLALVFTAFSLLVSYGSKLVISYLVGEWVLGKIAPQAKNPAVWAMVIGVVLYVILRAIPVLGWLIGVVVTFMGLGAMWLLYQNWRKPAASSPEAAPVVEMPAE